MRKLKAHFNPENREENAKTYYRYNTFLIGQVVFNDRTQCFGFIQKEDGRPEYTLYIFWEHGASSRVCTMRDDEIWIYRDITVLKKDSDLDTLENLKNILYEVENISMDEEKEAKHIKFIRVDI